MKRGEIRSLAGLRGCAAVMVMLYHFSLSVPADTLPLQGLLHNGYLCVDLFFVLSGFVMAYSQTGLFAGGYRLRIHVAYLGARLARIYPLYAIITIESFCLLVWRSADLDWLALGRTLLLNLVLIQAWGLAPSLEGATWSISTEWAAYLLFPLLLAVSALASRRTALISAAVSLLVVLAVAVWPTQVGFAGQGRSGPLDVYSSATALPLFRCVAEFTLGLTTFRFAQDLVGKMNGWAGPLAWVTVVAILVMSARAGADVYVVALFPVLIVALIPQQGGVAALLGAPMPYRLGLWSYSIYLVHDKFSHSVATLREWLAPRIPMASEFTVVIMGAVVIATAATSYLVIELPLRKLVLQAVKRSRSAPITTSAAADPAAIDPPPIVMAQ